jgi:hypothetical protein
LSKLRYDARPARARPSKPSALRGKIVGYKGLDFKLKISVPKVTIFEIELRPIDPRREGSKPHFPQNQILDSGTIIPYSAAIDFRPTTWPRISMRANDPPAIDIPSALARYLSIEI